MFKLTFFVAAVALTHCAALATHTGQKPISAPEESLENPLFCAIPDDCSKIDLNNIFPKHIPDLGAYIDGLLPICRVNAALATLCWVDIFTEGTCQVTLSWTGDVSRFKGEAVSRATIVEKATPLLTERNALSNCAGGQEPFHGDSGYWFLLVKTAGYDLF